MRVFLALPSNCPTDPGGSSRSIDGQTRADSVLLYASADEAQTFEQVAILNSFCYRVTMLHMSGESAVSACLSSQ